VIAKNAPGSAPPSLTWTFTTVPPSLTIASAHTDPFTQGQSNAAYTLTVTNGASAGATAGAVTVTETAPSGLIPVAMQGSGWTCAGPTCVRSDALAPGASYPAIALTVDVANNAPASVTNAATVAGGGSASASASDATAIDALPIYSNPLAFAVPASVVAGAPTTFTVTYASQAGSGDIASGQVQIDACYLEWDSSGNVALNDEASGTLGQNATLSAGGCSISLANSALSPVPGNPDALALSLALTFPEQSNGADFFGPHEVYAWGTSAEQIATAQVDLGALVVSPGQDYTLTVSPSGTTTVPYTGTVTLTVAATGLNGFTGQINLQIGLAPGTTNQCFGLWGSLPYLTANSQGSFTLQNNCPYGSSWSQFVITGSAPSIGVSRAGSSSPVLVATGGGDFTITPGLPTVSNLPAGGFISYPVTVTSVGSQSGNVSLTLAPPAGGSMPAGVTYQFAPAQVYLSGGQTAGSTLTLYSTAGTPGGAYPLVITGALGSAQRTAAFSLGTQVTGFQVTSATGSAIVHNTGQEVQVTHSVPAGNAPSYTACDSTDQDVSCRVISAAPGTVTLGITASASAVHGARVLTLNGGAAAVHAAVADVAPTGISVSPSGVEAGQWTQVPVVITGLNPCFDVVPYPCLDLAMMDSQGRRVGWASFDATRSILEIDPPLGSAGGYYLGADVCDCFDDPSGDPVDCGGGSWPLPVVSPSAPYVTGVTPSDIFPGTSGTITITGGGFTGATVTIGGTGVNQTGFGGTDNEIILGYSADLGADPGQRTITITTPWGLTGTTVAVSVSPCHMIVQSEYTQLCTGCQQTIGRWVTYLVVGSDKQTSVGQRGICESLSETWNSTTIPDPSRMEGITACDAPGATLPDGTFQDGWSLYRDIYPAGVGYDKVTDTWYGSGGVNQWIPVGAPQGYLHSDEIQINGFTSRYQNEQKMPKGTVMPGGCRP